VNTNAMKTGVVSDSNENEMKETSLYLITAPI
jgi:hypothetical protein